MQKRNKIIIFILLFLLILTSQAFAGIRINGWFNDWVKVRKIHLDKKKDTDSARSGMDFTAVAMKLTKKYLYIFIKIIDIHFSF